MKKKSTKKWLIPILLVTAIAASTFFVCGDKNDDENQAKTVKVEKKTIIDKALAVGAIEPIDEIAVKSKVSGVVGKIYVEEGDYIEKSTVVLDVNPDPTPMELAKAKRAVEMSAINKETLSKELERQKHMLSKGLISDQEFENLNQSYEEAALQLQISKEELELIEKGKIAGTNIETVVRAPISGYILTRQVNVGDPVVPLTSYQPGTELLTMANMSNLIFKGSVDEIDVGKISEGMPCELIVGALPGKKVKGHVQLISLKAQKEDNTTVFPVEIVVDDTDGAVLRAGYSANAEIIIARRDSVLSIPERVVYFRNDSTLVRLPADNEDGYDEVLVETGLSDAINIQITGGLKEDQEILEKETKEII